MRCPTNARVAVVRRETNLTHEKGLKIAWVVAQDEQGATIRFRVGGGYHPRQFRITASELVREATARERTLGYVL